MNCFLILADFQVNPAYKPNDQKTFPKLNKQALKTVSDSKKSSKQMSTFSCEKCQQRPLIFTKISGTADHFHGKPLVWETFFGR